MKTSGSPWTGILTVGSSDMTEEELEDISFDPDLIIEFIEALRSYLEKYAKQLKKRFDRDDIINLALMTMPNLAAQLETDFNFFEQVDDEDLASHNPARRRR